MLRAKEGGEERGEEATLPELRPAAAAAVPREAEREEAAAGVRAAVVVVGDFFAEESGALGGAAAAAAAAAAAGLAAPEAEGKGWGAAGGASEGDTWDMGAREEVDLARGAREAGERVERGGALPLACEGEAAEARDCCMPASQLTSLDSPLAALLMGAAPGGPRLLKGEPAGPWGAVAPLPALEDREALLRLCKGAEGL